MKGEKKMTTKRDEQRAWAKLKKAFPSNYCVLQHEFDRYSSGTEKISYHAYVQAPDGILSERFSTPMEAVDSIIQKVKEI